MSMKLLLLPITASAGAGLGFLPSGKERNLQQAETGDETKGHLEIQMFYQTTVDLPYQTMVNKSGMIDLRRGPHLVISILIPRWLNCQENAEELVPP